MIPLPENLRKMLVTLCPLISGEHSGYGVNVDWFVISSYDMILSSNFRVLVLYSFLVS